MGQRIDALLDEMSRLGVGDRRELKGCTARRILRLERRYAVKLPASYRAFLRILGQDSARLFAHDRVLTQYDDVLRLTENAREFVSEAAEEDPTNASRYRLPSDAIVILYRDSCDDFNFIRCNRAEDSSVWHFNQDLWPPRVVFRSVYTWLKAWCGESAQAIREGWAD